MVSCGNPSNNSYVAGCRCDACRAAHAAQEQVRELRNSRGESYLVDAAPVRARLEALYALGYTRRELVRLGINRSAQYHLTHAHPRTGRPVERVRRETSEAVFAVAGRRLAKRQLVPAAAAHRMLVDWKEGGIPITRIAKASGVGDRTLREIYHGRVESVTAETLVRLLSHKVEIDEIAIFARSATDGKRVRR